MSDGYQFDDIDTSKSPEAPVSTENTKSQEDKGYKGGKYADEIFSTQINAKFRTFYIDLKESNNGKFVKVSEKSHGRRSTIMMDSEDVLPMIDALQQVQDKL